MPSFTALEHELLLLEFFAVFSVMWAVLLNERVESLTVI